MKPKVVMTNSSLWNHCQKWIPKYIDTLEKQGYLTGVEFQELDIQRNVSNFTKLFKNYFRREKIPSGRQVNYYVVDLENLKKNIKLIQNNRYFLKIEMKNWIYCLLKRYKQYEVSKIVGLSEMMISEIKKKK